MKMLTAGLVLLLVGCAPTQTTEPQLDSGCLTGVPNKSGGVQAHPATIIYPCDVAV